jgi:hypothetical protein
MTRHTHQTVPTQYVEANGIRFAYRRFGNPVGVPLVMNIHFTGTMDHSGVIDFLRMGEWLEPVCVPRRFRDLAAVRSPWFRIGGA